MKINGGCHCGKITYSAEVDPDKVGICHCTDCQTLSGTAFRVSVAATKEAFHLESGQPKIYVKTAESGAKRAQAFCPECGTPICSAAVSDPQVFNIRVGAAAMNSEPLSFVLPVRQAKLFRWCLREGFRAVLPMTLMAMGKYQEPKGCYMPSILY